MLLPIFTAKMTTLWQHSLAKKILEKDLIDGLIGTVEDGLPPSDVYLMHTEYTEFEYKNFVSNLYNLRKKHEDLLTRAKEDAEALAHDLALGLRVHTKPYPCWQGSVAERLLQKDIDEGKLLNMKPAELLKSRVEYNPWIQYPKVFRDHIQQELRARKERPYWMARRKEKQEAKRKAKKSLKKK